MFYLQLLLALISGLLLIKVDYLFIFIGVFAVLVTSIIAKKSWVLRGFWLICCAFALGIILSVLPLVLSTIRPESFLGIVIKEGNGYVIINSIYGKYFCYSDELKLYSIYKFNVTNVENIISNIGENFAFETFLKNENVLKFVRLNEVETILSSPFDFNVYENKILSKFQDEKALLIMKSLLFGNDSDEISRISSKLMIANLLSSTGLFLNFILYGLAKIFSYFTTNKMAKTFSAIILLPFFFFNIHRFSFLRVYVFFIVSILTSNVKRVDRFGLSCFIYFVFLVLSPSLIFKTSYYLPLLIRIILKFTNQYTKNCKFPFQSNLKKKVLIAITLIPTVISSYNGFNILNTLFSYTFVFYFKALFSLAVICFYGIKLPFLENIFSFTYDVLDTLDFSYLTINLPKLNGLLTILFYGLFIIFIYFKEINFKKIYRKIAVVIGVFACLYVIPIEHLVLFEICYLNVGQGDATFIRYHNKSYLIDTGGLTNFDIATSVLIPTLKSRRFYSLEAVFITHYDFDHYGALDSLCNNFKVKNIFDYSSDFPYIYKDLTIKNLNPFLFEEGLDENDKSLVLEISVKDYKFLIMGDASTSIEKKIIEDVENNSYNHLKVGHHGSNSSSSYEFLKAVDPEVAIISVGKNNRYGHPHEDVINRLNSLNIPYLRTDQEGSISYKYFV